MFSARILSVAIGLSALTSLTMAQDLTHIIGSLSGSCQAAAGSLMASEFATCANIMGLIPVIGAPSSIVTPFAGWVNELCPMSPCSDAVVADASKNVQNGCSGDFAKVPVSVALATIVANYVPIRKMLCEQWASNGTSCINSLLASIEKASGKPVTVDMIESVIVGGFASLGSVLAAIPKETYCHDCGHALYSDSLAIKPIASASNSTSPAASSDGLVSAVCGAAFADHKVPSTIKQAPTTGGSNSTSAGASSTYGTTGAAADASSAAGKLSSCLSMVLVAFVPVIAVFTL